MKKKYFKLKSQLVAIFILLFFVIALSAYNYLRAVASPIVQFTADVIVSLTGINDGNLYVVSGSEAGSVDITGSYLSVIAIPDGSSFTLKTPQHSNALSLTPAGGTMNFSIDSSQISSGNILQWTINAPSDRIINHIVGVPKPNTVYDLKINNVYSTSFTSGAGSEISFSIHGTFADIKLEEGVSSGGLIPGYGDSPTSPSSTAANPAGEFNVIVIEPTDDILNDDIPSIVITETADRIVTLRLFAGPDTKRMTISEDPEFKNADQVPYERIVKWILSKGDGPKTIYVKFFTEYGVPSPTVSVNIFLKTVPGVLEPGEPGVPGEGEEAGEPGAGEPGIPGEEVIVPGGKPPIQIYGPGVTKKKFRHVAGDFDFYRGISSTFYAVWAEEIVGTVRFVIITAESFITTIFDFIAYGVAKLVPDSLEDKLFNPKETEALRMILQPQICNEKFYRGLSGTITGCIAERIVQAEKQKCKRIKARIILIFDYAINDVSKAVPDSLEDKLFNSSKKRNTFFIKAKQIFRDAFSL